MTTLTTTELQTILTNHAKWVAGVPGAKLADLSRADLSGADLSYANLSRANLSRANLHGADLHGAILYGAYLSRADLSGADLSGADLRYANLHDANLRGAKLTGANLSGAVKDAKTILPFYQIVPEAGSFMAFKKLRNNVIATLEIPADAKRTSSLVGRKCRAEFARVVSLSDGAEVGYSQHAEDFAYHMGEIVRPDAFDDDIRVECASGIHFFITRAEAESY